MACTAAGDGGSLSAPVTPVTWNLVPKWLPCQTPSVIGSVLGLVSLVSVYRPVVYYTAYGLYCSRRRGFTLCSSHSSDVKLGTEVTTLSNTFRDRVSARTGQPGVSLLSWVHWCGSNLELQLPSQWGSTCTCLSRDFVCCWGVMQPVNEWRN